VNYLSRKICYEERRFYMEGDRKHSDILIKEWNMEHCKPVDTPITRECKAKFGMGEHLTEGEDTKARRAIARINFMAQDRGDLAFTAKSMSQHMSSPREGILVGIKRVIRYLKGRPVLRLRFDGVEDECDEDMEVYNDSDWANDEDTRKSCSGGCILLGGNLMTCWSKTQSNIALSSGEAELNAAVKGLSEAIGILELYKEIYDKKINFKVYTDSSACKGMLLRHGSGRVKHLTTKQLWVQNAVKAYEVEVVKVPREFNVADVFTHEVTKISMDNGLEVLGYE
jgi:hypothetical protein